MRAAGIGREEAVLDIGCGTGQTTRDAARIAVAGSVVGMDLSAAMLREARRRAAGEGLGNMSFERPSGRPGARGG
ncbi:class I SAM-dependent methyltransferase [Streptomyces toxytricini]|uniref:class I SAM-dependent methyltransferase n=1 Tax=Streptomyces toxytricini TaxID=67369 RepID=UPI00342E4975